MNTALKIFRFLLALLLVLVATLLVAMQIPAFQTYIARKAVEKRKYRSEEDRKKAEETGVLYSSGLIAGEGLVGILLALLAVIHVGDRSIGEIIDVSGKLNLGNTGGLAAYLLLVGTLFLFIRKSLKKRS